MSKGQPVRNSTAIQPLSLRPSVGGAGLGGQTDLDRKVALQTK